MLDNTQAPQKAWVLTREALDRLLEHLDSDRERAGEKYLHLRRALVKFFDWREAAEPEGRADETINRVARKIHSGEEIHNLNSYAYGVARLVLLEALKEQRKEQEALNSMPLLVQNGQATGEADLRLDCFDQCLESLTAESRELIIGYYQEEKQAKIDARRKMAARIGIQVNALRIRAHRLRARLEECVHGCVGESAHRPQAK